MPELDLSQGRLLGALTLAMVKHLGDDTGVIDADGQLRTWRVVLVGADIALVDLPADEGGPRCINYYSVAEKRFDAIDGKKFKIAPEELQQRPDHDRKMTVAITAHIHASGASMFRKLVIGALTAATAVLCSTAAIAAGTEADAKAMLQ
jgi:hypothetical protein